MDTNIKVVGFANQSINGVNINNEGFDLEYDGKMLNLSGFSGDKLYYAKLNNQQILDLLQKESSQVPLEQRIMMYREKIPKKYSKKKTIKLIKLSHHSPHHKSIRSRHRSNKASSYKSPKMRSEFRRSTIGKSHMTRSKNKHSKVSSKYKTIY